MLNPAGSSATCQNHSGRARRRGQNEVGMAAVGNHFPVTPGGIVLHSKEYLAIEEPAPFAAYCNLTCETY